MKETIKPRLDISYDDIDNPTEWKSVLAHQIEQKMKMGNELKLTPIIYGPQNVHVDSNISELADQYNLRFINIDISTYTINDIPARLYKDIINYIKMLDEVYMSNLSTSETNLYNSQTWKYLIYFDNINCVESINFFSAIRSIFYEKRFPDGQILPEQSILIGRMSKQETGTVELNSYLRDILTIIPYSI